MAISKVSAFIGTDEAGRVYDAAMSACPRYTAIFTNGDRWTFRMANMVAAQSHARFWAEFTARELSAVIGN